MNYHEAETYTAPLPHFAVGQGQIQNPQKQREKKVKLFMSASRFNVCMPVFSLGYFVRSTSSGRGHQGIDACFGEPTEGLPKKLIVFFSCFYFL